MRAGSRRMVATRGVSPIVAIVLLLSIAVISGAGVYLWMAGTATQHPTGDAPSAISVMLIENNAGSMEILIANMATATIPAGTVFQVAENGIEANLTNDLGPGEQTRIKFWGRVDSEGSTHLFERQATVFAPATGVGAPSIVLPPVSAEEIITYNASAVWSTGYDPSVISTRDVNGLYWMTFSSDAEASESHDIFIRNSSDGLSWNTLVTAAAEGNPPAIQEDTPFMVKDVYGTFWVIYRSYANGTTRLRMVNSTDGNSWAYPLWSNITFVGVGNDFDYRLDNLRGFSFLRDTDDLFWIAYQYDNELRVRNSTDALNWSEEIVVDSSISPGRASIIKVGGVFWAVAVGSDTKTIEVFSSSTGADWSRMSVVSDPEFGDACTGPSLLYAESAFFLFTDMKNSTGDCEKMQVLASEDGVHWSAPSFMQSFSGVDISPYAIYDNGVYWLAFGNSALQTLYIRSSTDPMIWQDVA